MIFIQAGRPAACRLPEKARCLLLLLCLSFLSAVIAGHGDISPGLMTWVEGRYGAPAKGRILSWRDLIARNQGLDTPQQLKLVNDFFNRVAYGTDQAIWGKADYWATPLEMLSINAADCEDYSIAKYFTLRAMGIPVEKLRITYVKSLELNQAHMVLVYYERPDAEPLVLDNLTGQIKMASQRRDLAPIYSFNGEGLWLAKRRGRGKRVGRSERIDLWRDLINRMEREEE